MRTKSSSSVLTSLSTVVTDLTTLIAQTLASGTLPPLDGLSQGVVNQVDVLAQVSERIIEVNGDDDELKSGIRAGVVMGNSDLMYTLTNV